MLKYLFILVFMLAATVSALFFIPGPGGDPMLNMDLLNRSLKGGWSFSQDAQKIRSTAEEQLESMRDKAKKFVKPKKTERFDAPVESPQETLFKWHDAKGNLHFTNQLPPDGTAFEIVE